MQNYARAPTLPAVATRLTPAAEFATWGPSGRAALISTRIALASTATPAASTTDPAIRAPITSAKPSATTAWSYCHRWT